MSKLQLFSFLLVAITFFCSCKSTKSIGNKDTKIKGLDQVDFKSFSSKLKIDYTDAEQSIGLNAILRMQKDEIVWMTITGPFGVKVAKLKLTEDSILVLQDYPDKIFSAYSVKEFNKKYNTDISVKQVQNLLLGNLLFDSKSKIVNEDDKLLIKQNSGVFEILNVLEGEKIKEVKVSSASQPGNINLVYDEYQNHNTHIVPEKAKLDISHPSFTAKVEMQHKNISFTNENLDFPFTVSEKYVRK